ncbi:MAG: AMP-binding protein, partial [Anaerolineales bacterium]|nr:AMP-binding protein [Anaerolineales bacterium]
MQTISDLIGKSSREYGSLVAVKMRSGLRLEKFTYHDLNQRAELMAEVLNNVGMRKGDRVVLWGPNSPSWVIAYLGILFGGGVVVPLDIGSTTTFINKVILQTEPVLAIVRKSKFESIEHLSIPSLDLDDLPFLLSQAQGQFLPPQLEGEDLAEIMYTSGTTGEPKGVMLTHENLISNVEMGTQIMQVDPGSSILSLLPLSHMFEQIIGLLIPLKCGAKIIYVPSRQPQIVMNALRNEKITAMILVPHALQLLMSQIEREVISKVGHKIWQTLLRIGQRLPIALRQFLFRPIHKALGSQLKFLAIGGAFLDPKLIQKWESIGVPIIQGYGATEVTALATGSSTLERRLGSVGKNSPGQELKIASDGEILIRGKNVSRGYWKNPIATETTFSNGWYSTGDLGNIDSDGYVYFKGRKKNLIVLADGMNVYPEDIENHLNLEPDIIEAIVLGITRSDGRVEIHAFILAETTETIEKTIRTANACLAPHQQIHGYTIWPEEDFPRTHTLKVKRYKLQEAISAEEKTIKDSALSPPQSMKDLRSLASEISDLPKEQIEPRHNLALDLGMDSLSKVELLCLIEEELGIYVDEVQLQADATIEDLQAILDEEHEAKVTTSFPDWPYKESVRVIRAIIQRLVVNPFLAIMCPMNIIGDENLKGLDDPVLFVANHTSHFDAPLTLKVLQKNHRRKISAAAAADYWFSNPLLGFPTSLVFNIFPMARKGNVKPSMEHVVDLIDKGWSILIFPEGTRSLTGEIQSFKAGAGLLAVEVGVPVLPIHLSGVYEILPKGSLLPRRGPVLVRIGAPMRFDPWMNHSQVSIHIENEVRRLSEL